MHKKQKEKVEVNRVNSYSDTKLIPRRIRISRSQFLLFCTLLTLKYPFFSLIVVCYCVIVPTTLSL